MAGKSRPRINYRWGYRLEKNTYLKLQLTLCLQIVRAHNAAALPRHGPHLCSPVLGSVGPRQPHPGECHDKKLKGKIINLNTFFKSVIEEFNLAYLSPFSNKIVTIYQKIPTSPG